MLVNLRALLGGFVDIILMRRGPEHLPASVVVLVCTVAVNLAIYAITTVVGPKPPENWLLQLAAASAVSLLWFQLALTLLRKRERFVQTMTAIFGTNAIFLPAMVPLGAAVLPYLQKKADDVAAAPPSALLILFMILGLWQLVVQVRIVHAAFEWPYFASVLFIFGQGFVSLIVFFILFGVPQSPA